MPLHDLRCNECQSEDICLMIKMDDPNPPCPKCGKDALEKLISVPVTRVAEITGPIWCDKQIESTHGKNWRETAKNPYRPGGDRKRLYNF